MYIKIEERPKYPAGERVEKSISKPSKLEVLSVLVKLYPICITVGLRKWFFSLASPQ